MKLYRFVQFWSKRSEIVRNEQKIRKTFDFVGFPGIDEIRSDFDVNKILISCDGHKMTYTIGIRITLDVNMGCKMPDTIGSRTIFLSNFCPYFHPTAGDGI